MTGPTLTLDGLDASAVAATADPAVSMNGHVPKFSGYPVPPNQHPTIDGDSVSKTGADVAADHDATPRQLVVG